MATISTSDFDTNVNKRPDFRAIGASKLKMFVVTVTFGAAENYVTGGNNISLKEGKISTYLAVVPVSNDVGVVVEYIEATELMKMREAGTAGAPLDELASGDTVTQNGVFKFLVLGI